MARGVGGKSPANVQKFLRGVDYPSGKRDLIEAAMDNQAPKDILDMLWDMPEQDFGGPQDVQKAIGWDEDEPQDEERGRTGHSAEDLVYHFLEYKGEADSYMVSRMLNREGIQAPATQILRNMLHNGDLEKNGDNYTLRGKSPKREQSQVERRREPPPQQPQPRQQPAQEEDVDSHRRPKDPQIEERIGEYEERYEQNQNRRSRPAREADDSEWTEWDHRLKGHQTKAIDDARKMRHGYDGRGVVEHPDRDQRLRGQESEALDEARHMRRGYDGRGRVTKRGPNDQDEDNARFPGAAVNVHE